MWFPRTLPFVLLLLALCGGAALAQGLPPQTGGDRLDPGLPVSASAKTDPPSAEQLKIYEESLLPTGLGADAIPPIDAPHYISVGNASLTYERADVAFFVETKDGVYIYPQPVLVWHEIVNDTLDLGDGPEPVSLTYCPLTGSAIGYRGTLGALGKGPRTTFGTSGMLLNSNQVLYDRTTFSLFPQILGMGIAGRLTGEILRKFPVSWSTFGALAKRYPEARVLSTDTGHRRDYGHDPYGSYHKRDSYYQNGAIRYPMLKLDRSLPPKTRTICLVRDGYKLAVARERVTREGAVNVAFGLTPLVLTYDAGLDAVRVFERTVPGAGETRRDLTFDLDRGRLKDRETGSSWSLEGRLVTGSARAERLTPFPFFESMWFGWAAYHPSPVLR